jgi:hypothetical protein
MTTTKTSTSARSTPKPAKRVKSAALKPVARAAKATPQPAPKTTAKQLKTVVETAVTVAAAVAKQKNKLVRDSFTIPKSEYSVLEGLKLRAAMLKRPTKKSEILRAGISVLNLMTDKQFLAAVDAVPSLKTGRPPADALETPPVK